MSSALPAADSDYIDYYYDATDASSGRQSTLSGKTGGRVVATDSAAASASTGGVGEATIADNEAACEGAKTVTIQHSARGENTSDSVATPIAISDSREQFLTVGNSTVVPAESVVFRDDEKSEQTKSLKRKIDSEEIEP